MSSLMSRIQNLLRSDHWTQKHAGLVTIYQCLENLESHGVKFSDILELVTMNAQGNHSLSNYSFIM